MKTQEAIKILNISRMTLHNYVKAGKIKVKTRRGGRRFEYDDESIYKLAGIEQPLKCLIDIQLNENNMRYSIENKEKAIRIIEFITKELT